MNEYETLRLPLTSPFVSTMELTDLPLEMILYMAKFLSFEDYRNFVRSLWPNNDEAETVRRKVWELSTRKISTKFLNQKDLKIEYNYDRSRSKDDRILLSWDSFLPVFGDLGPPKGMDSFVSFTTVHNFIKCHVHMDECSKRQHASCFCHRLGTDTLANVIRARPTNTECSYGHFHHYCYNHLANWLNIFLYSLIIQHETGEIDEEANQEILRVLGTTVCV